MTEAIVRPIEQAPEITVTPKVVEGDSIAEASGGRKVLSITIEFEVGAKKTHNTRLKEAYKAAVKAADSAVRDILLDDSITGLMSRMVYDYRHLEGSMVPWDVVHADDGGKGDEAEDEE